jgi:hypothetical protein
MNRLMSLAASNSLAGSTDSMVARGMSASGNAAASSDGSGDPAKQEAVQQIRAALAALAQLNEAAYEAQHLLGMVPEGQAGEQQQGDSMAAVLEGGFEDGSLNPGLQQQEGLNGSGAVGAPFQQFAAWSGGVSVGSRSWRRSSGGFSGDFDGRPSSFTSGSGALRTAASSHMRRVSVDGGGADSTWRGSASGAAARAAASRGRVSVDLGAVGGNGEARMRQLCPNLVKCEREQLAAIARREQQQQ